MAEASGSRPAAVVPIPNAQHRAAGILIYGLHRTIDDLPVELHYGVTIKGDQIEAERESHGTFSLLAIPLYTDSTESHRSLGGRRNSRAVQGNLKAVHSVSRVTPRPQSRRQDDRLEFLSMCVLEVVHNAWSWRQRWVL